ECRGTLTRDQLFRLQTRLADGEAVCPELLEPVIDVGRDGVQLDGELVATSLPRTVYEPVRPLVAALKNERETWKVLHPGEQFPGMASITVAPDVTAQVGAAIVSSTALTGYPRFAVRSGAVRLSSAFPSRSMPLSVSSNDPFAPKTPEPPEVLVIRADPGAMVELRFQGAVTPRFGLKRRGTPGALADLVASECARPPTCTAEVVVEVGDTTFFEAVDAAQKAIARLPSPPTALSFEAVFPKLPKPPPPTPSKSRGSLRFGALTLQGPLTADAVARVLQANEAEFRECYQEALEHEPKLAGRAVTRFVIGRDGISHKAGNGGSDLPSRSTLDCIISAHNGLQFPEPDSNVVLVNAPLLLSPR
ncbi:MAG TPA: AgmX/PglI C-terminal domain-containing protein, partial [Polyangiaceae bacterium]|nr:AgmX/PglI C-terminal domain-containing protein [Polyangiaceae bacterium]